MSDWQVIVLIFTGVLPRKASADKVKFLTVGEVRTAPPPLWLIHRVIVMHGFTVLYGYRGLGKSHVALDLAYHVAQGMAWNGYRTRIGNVIYVMASEGAYGMGSRLRAWEEYHEREVDHDAIRYLTSPVLLAELSSVKRFVKLIWEEHFDPSLIVLDTLARCAPGVDENSFETMSLIVQGVDYIREQTGASVLLVHHTAGRPDGESSQHMRGHTSLESAVDTVIQLAGPPLALHCEKQKEAPDFHSIYLELESVGESCVPIRIERPAPDDGGFSQKKPHSLWPDRQK